MKRHIERERRELAENPEHERRELAAIYVRRGLPKSLANEVADALSRHDELAAHTRDELGINEITAANPVQAALASAASFTVGGILPLAAGFLARGKASLPALVIVTIVGLAGLGAAGARSGGAPVAAAIVRVVLWGSLAMAVTAAVGRMFGASI